MARLARAVDCRYIAPQIMASFLVRSGQAACGWIDSSTPSSVPHVLRALAADDVAREDVTHIVITHVHLDHSAGCAALAEACPNAQVLAHPEAVAHLVDPCKLERSARQIFGDAEFEALYGARLEPVPASRITALRDGAQFALGDKTLGILHTRGHANHHLVVHDTATGEVFAGDSFGLAYPSLQSRGQLSIPSTSPTDFDAAEARKSVRAIMALRPSAIYVSHFGRVVDIEAAAAQLLHHLDFSEAVLESAVRCAEPDAALTAFCEHRLNAYYDELFTSRGLAAEAWAIISQSKDMVLNAQGLAHVAVRRRNRAAVSAALAAAKR